MYALIRVCAGSCGPSLREIVIAALLGAATFASRPCEGVTWNRVSDDAPDVSCAVVFSDHLWLLGHDFDDIWRSTDGLTWEQLESPIQGFIDWTFISLAFNGRIWLVEMGGSYLPGSQTWDGNVFSTADGSTWIEEYAGMLGGGYGHTGVVHGGKMWILGGLVESPDPWPEEGEMDPYVVSDVWSSVDGRAWEYVRAAPWVPRWGHTSVVFGGKMWVLGGQGGTTPPWSCFNDVWYSEDGLDWVCVTESAPWCPRTQHVSVVHDGRIWVIYGNGDHGQEDDIWTTEDGLDWTCVTDHRPWPGILPYSAVEYQEKMWVFSSGTSFYDWDHDDVWTMGTGAEEGETALEIKLFHSADYETAWNPGLIKLQELLRVIQFYNSSGYHCEACTEDDYAVDLGDASCRPHDADYNPQDWHIGLSELLRVIQFYNSGAYYPCPDAATEDGFCPGAG